MGVIRVWGLTLTPVDWRRVEEEGQKDETSLDSVTNKSALGSQRRRGKGRDGWGSEEGGKCVAEGLRHEVRAFEVAFEDAFLD